MHYDIAAKILIEKCREEILRRLVGLPVTESTIIEDAPQETVSLRRSDFPIMIEEEDGGRRLVILEVQSRWDRRVPVRLLDYRARYLLKYDVEVISCVLLLRPSAGASADYEDNEVRFRFRLIPVYELDARDIIDQNVLCLMPFVPLMRHGEELLDKADDALYTGYSI